MSSTLAALRLTQDRRPGGLPLPHPPGRPLESSTRSVRLVAAFVWSKCSAPPGTRPTGHDCLAVRPSPPTWRPRHVMSFLINTASSRPFYLLHAPTLPRLNHLVDVPGTESSLPAAAELPRLADVVEMEFRSLVEVMCSTLLTRYVPSSRPVAVAATCPSRFRGLEPTSRPLPFRAAVRGSATSLPSLTGKPSRASHG